MTENSFIFEIDIKFSALQRVFIKFCVMGCKSRAFSPLAQNCFFFKVLSFKTCALA